MSIYDYCVKQDIYYAPPGVTIRHKGYEEKQESIKFWAIVVVIILIVIGLGVGLYFVFKKKPSSSPSSPSSSNQSSSEKYEQENKRRSMNSAFSRGHIFTRTGKKV